MIIRKKFTFDASHSLPNYKGKCANLHGHTWTLWVSIEGFYDGETGMIVDFMEIKRLVNELIIDKFDHSHLNNIIPNPTCENLAIHIKRILGRAIESLSGNGRFFLSEITLSETEGNEVTH